jgi:quinol monooxygenase YgiN
MHALMITFRTSIPADQLAAPFEAYAAELRKQPGLITKAWIRDGDTFGGFHIFESEETADAYVRSELAAGLRATEGFDDFDVRGFEVLEDLSAMTGINASRPLARQA